MIPLRVENSAFHLEFGRENAEVVLDRVLVRLGVEKLHRVEPFGNERILCLVDDELFADCVEHITIDLRRLLATIRIKIL